MNNFNPYYLFLALFLFSLTACDDNFEIEEEPQIETSDPVEVSVTRITGLVEDLSNQVVADAEVSYTHNNAIHSVFTDQNGVYNIELPADESDILLQVEADSYLTSGLNPVSLVEGVNEKNIKLLQNDQTDYNGEIGLLELNETANLSGRVLLANGEPAEDVIVFLIDFSDFNFSSYTITDENGEYLIAAEPFENFALVALSQCNDVGLIAENIMLETEDLDFGDFQSEYVEVSKFTVSGFVTNCFTDEGLTSGQVQITLEGDPERYEAEIIDGFYSVEVDNCSGASCYNMTISAPLILTEFLEIECATISSEAITSDHTLCGEEFVLEGEIRVQIGTDSLIFNNATAGIDETTGSRIIFGFSDLHELTFFAFTDIDSTGMFGVEAIAIGEGSNATYSNFQGSNLPFVFDITEFGDYMIGTLTGEVLDPSGNVLPISGTLDIKLY